MRLVTYRHLGSQRAGAVAGEWVVDLERAHGGAPVSASLRGLLAGGEPALAAAAAATARVAGQLPERAAELRQAGIALPLAEIRLAPPVPDPGKIICLGRNYRAHAAESGVAPPAYPELFSKFANALIGHGDPIRLPAASDSVDYEAELAFVIGRRGRDIGEAAALDHVAGYTVFNDVSARDFQFRTSQWLAGKGFDTFAPCGPWLVTPDELPSAGDCRISLRLGGETLQDSTTANLIFGIPEIVAYVSRIMTLEPGDLISTGTPEGVGFVRRPPRFLRPGERVSITIEGIGTLENPVEAAPAAS